MSRTNTAILKAALHTFHATGAHKVAAPLTGGIGAIFMLHNVAPDPGHSFEPNRILRITPQFLEQVIGLVDDMGFDVIALDDIPSRLAQGRDAKPFVVFTFDDGYRDNRDYALPIFKKHDLPMAVYVPSDFASGTGDLWWLALENAIRASTSIDIELNGQRLQFQTRTDQQKEVAHHQIYWALRALPETDARAAVARLCELIGYDASELCRQLVMDWNELRQFAADPLVTIGAHTTGHYALAKLDAATARRQMTESIAAIETELDLPCRHFSYPYGNESACGPREFALARQLGMTTAVTTRKGLIHARHKTLPTSLPRVSLNGDFQDIRLVKTLLSGAPFALLQAYDNLTQLPNAARSFLTPRRLVTSTG
ncbi:MAG: polysaccharide deacetylase family protein [Alphaproteobacteria bacterium]|nr:polysaccharide deacetylase family protein [Alphaproteobacteria bacterium]